ncbi:MAG: hypothetical protein K1X81_13005 [Bacteroidia bacterium]|nr:hypothetical protein [Bacteroidia bacterium]
MLSVFSYGQGQVTLHAGVTQPLLISKSKWDALFRNPDLSPVLLYGIALRVDSAKKSSLYFETDVFSGKGKDMKWGSVGGYATSSLQYRVITFGLVKKFRLGTDKLFALTGLSVSSSFLKWEGIEVNGFGGSISETLLRGRTKGGNVGIQAGIGYRLKSLTFSARMRLISYFKKMGWGSFNLDHSAVSLTMGYNFTTRSKVNIAAPKGKGRRPIGLLSGCRMAVLTIHRDSSVYNSYTRRIDECEKVVKGKEFSFFIIYPLINRLSLVTEAGVAYATYNVTYTDNYHLDNYSQDWYKLKYEVYTLNSSILARYGIGKRECFFIQAGIGISDRIKFKASGFFDYNYFIGSAWVKRIHSFYVEDFWLFPFNISTQNALVGFGLQRIKIGNRRLFAEMRASAPLERAYNTKHFSKDNLVTSFSVGVFFNKFR